MWNLDHFKAVARPIELWWTHSKVECRWAMALAELPGYHCPAPGFGSNDCKICPAHFYHHVGPPSAEEFAVHIRQAIPDHAPIFRKSLP
jgi:Uri superfamily endonuclease